MRFAFKLLFPQNTTWGDMLAVGKEADGIELFESRLDLRPLLCRESPTARALPEGWVTLSRAARQAARSLRLGRWSPAFTMIVRAPAVLGKPWPPP